jgi:uncharacterized membrane protein required for colicin V production
MGLDLALGGLVLLAAIRGWFKGFVLQAIRLSGLIACVYAADPLRDQVKPHVIGYLSTMKPDLIDRLLWWASAVVAYVVLVGLASLIVKLYRQRPFGLDEPNRGDQFAGFLLGAAKGLLVVSLTVSGVQKYALGYLKSIPQAQELIADSKALKLDARLHPADQFWAFPPVKLFVARVQRGGLTGPPRDQAAATEALKTAARTPKLQWSASGEPEINLKDIDPEVAEAVETVKEALRKGRIGN